MSLSRLAGRCHRRPSLRRHLRLARLRSQESTVGAADLIDWNRRMAPNGIAGTLGIDWPALMRFKRGFTDPVPKQREQALRDAGIDVFPGRAGFETPDSLRVGDNIFRARH